MPYGPINFNDLALLPPLFHGVLSLLHHTEPCIPDLVECQFGCKQRVSKPVIDPIRAHRLSKILAYKVDYDQGYWIWSSQGWHTLSIEELGDVVTMQ